MRELRPDFQQSLTELIQNELHEARRDDSLKIIRLEQEIESLKTTIQAKDELIEKLTKQLQESKDDNSKREKSILDSVLMPSPAKKRVSLTASTKNMNAPKPPTSSVDTRLVQSMYDRIHTMETQYSDSEIEEDEDGNLRISPKKSIVQFSSQGSVNFSPKRKLIFLPNKNNTHVSPLRKIPKLEAKEGNSADIPTQYSSSSPSITDHELLSSPTKPGRSAVTKNNKSKTTYDTSKVSESNNELPNPFDSQQQEDEDEVVEVVEDSQEHYEEVVLSSSPVPTQVDISIPPDLVTINQQRQYRLQFYINKYENDPTFKISFKNHPVKLIGWDFSDFVVNDNYRPDEFTKFLRRNNIKDKKKYDAFKKVYGDKEEVKKFGNFDDKLSQIFDKFQSPPGFMRSEFPNTQELARRKEIIAERQKNRLNRRVQAAITVEDGVQTGEFIFGIDIFNKFVVSGRYYE